MYLSKTFIFWAALLFVLNTCVAFAVVYTKHNARAAHIELSELNTAIDNLNVEWGRLQLEEGALSEYGRIEHIARQRLGMDLPKPSDVRLVR
ncbi:MAG TPA: cell division protein FtsL [Gammaproteobacteria bacterium]|jgi:cell division protein FtsL|nr:cell division protein FtsL [Gammaproteobacteria bacterium]